MKVRQDDTRTEMHNNGNGRQVFDTSPWTDAFMGQAGRNGHGANGHNGDRPAAATDDTSTRDALMQCYNG